MNNSAVLNLIKPDINIWFLAKIYHSNPWKYYK